MAILTLPIGPHGLLTDLIVSVPKPRQEALRSAGKTWPKEMTIVAQIDTGAYQTCIDHRIVDHLDLPWRAAVQILTPSTGGTPHTCDEHEAHLTLFHPHHRLELDETPCLAIALDDDHVQALIGRDVLEKCLLILDGPRSTFTLAF